MAVRKPKIDPRALKLKTLRESIRDLQKEADSLKKNLVADYALGDHPGFTILEKTKMLLDQDLLEKKLGSLDPYKSPSTATYIEFTKV